MYAIAHVCYCDVRGPVVRLDDCDDAGVPILYATQDEAIDFLRSSRGCTPGGFSAGERVVVEVVGDAGGDPDDSYIDWDVCPFDAETEYEDALRWAAERAIDDGGIVAAGEFLVSFPVRETV